MDKKTSQFRFTNKMLVVAIVAALLCGGLYGWTYVVVKNTAKRAEALETETENFSKAEREIDTLRKNLQSSDIERKELASHFVEIGNIVPLLETIEEYGRRENILVTYSNVSLEKDTGNLSVEFYGSGSFLGLYRFLALVENLPYEAAISKATVTNSVSGSQKNQSAKPSSGDWEAHATLIVSSVVK